MTISTSATSLKSVLDNANPNTLADKFRALKIGSCIRAMTTFLRKKVPAASSYQLATLHAHVLPDDAKASTILRAFSRTGGVTGELVVKLYGVTPGTGEIAVGPNGDIVVLAADAITSLDVTYQPEKQDVYELTLDVPAATGICAIPASFVSQGVINLLEAEALTGTVTGRKIVLVPGAAPATTQARLSAAKNTVLFNLATDVVTSARIKFSVVPTTDVDALLTAESATQ